MPTPAELVAALWPDQQTSTPPDGLLSAQLMARGLLHGMEQQPQPAFAEQSRGRLKAGTAKIAPTEEESAMIRALGGALPGEAGPPRGSMLGALTGTTQASHDMFPTVGTEPKPTAAESRGRLGAGTQAIPPAPGDVGARRSIPDPESERLQMWPERMVRSGATVARDAITGEDPSLTAGLLGVPGLTDDPAEANAARDYALGRASDAAGLATAGAMPLGARVRAPALGAGGAGRVPPRDNVVRFPRTEQDVRNFSATAPKEPQPGQPTADVVPFPAEARSTLDTLRSGLGSDEEGPKAPAIIDPLADRGQVAKAIEGLPSKASVPGVGDIEVGPHAPARAAAENYMRSIGADYNPPKTYAKVDVARAKKIADEFEKMAHAPNDPTVRAAYQKMADETMAQWKAIKDTGLKVEFMPPGENPYEASPRLAVEDVKKNNHVYVYPTDEGFGEVGKGISPAAEAENPLLAQSGETISGRPARVNDIFRAVHDYFGHAKEGVGFRGEGEENAWRSHAAMYSPLARRAMTTETRGQNSWLNYGPHGEKNRTAKTPDTVFAEQKIGLLPEWVSEEGMHDEAGPRGTTLRSGIGSSDEPGPKAPVVAPPLYSQLEKTVSEHKQNKATAEQWANTLKNAPGVKQAELENSRLLDWLRTEHLPKDVVTRDDVAARVREQTPHVQVVRKGSDVPGTHPQYDEYQLPGGTNYRETLLTLPIDKEMDQAALAKYGKPYGELPNGNKVATRQSVGDFKGTHWDEPNVVVHVRHNDRTIPGEGFSVQNAKSKNKGPVFATREEAQAYQRALPDSVRNDVSVISAPRPQSALHMEEVQSDWHQKGRKEGYNRPLTTEDFVVRSRLPDQRWYVKTQGEAGETFFPNETAARAWINSRIGSRPGTSSGFKEGLGVPDAPFKKTWHELALKRMLHEASTAKNPDGSFKYDALSWTPGEAQAERYDLSHQVDAIRTVKHADNSYSIEVKPKGERGFRTLSAETVPEAKLADHIGKDLAEKVASQEPGNYKTYSGLDLKVGGEGMRAFYDKMMVDAANKIGKPHGAKVEQRPLEVRLGAKERDRHYQEHGEFPEGEQTHSIHVLPITPKLRAEASKGFSLFSGMGGGAEGEGIPAPVMMPAVNRKSPTGQTVADPQRNAFPGIYGNPEEIAREAASRAEPEHPALRALFGVSRDDLNQIGQGREGNREPDVPWKKNPTGSLAAKNIQTPRNTQRILDVLSAGERHAPDVTKGADAWYVMDPAYRRLEQISDNPKKDYENLNTFTGMASPSSNVVTELNRGTAANFFHGHGRFADFQKYGGVKEKEKIRRLPPDMVSVQGHPYHATAQAPAMQYYGATGDVSMKSPKVPAYIRASGVPETGFQTKYPVQDAHFSRGVGMADTRTEKDFGRSANLPEAQTVNPWWQEEIARPLGIESVPAQARAWTLFGPHTDVDSTLGAPKLEILAKQMFESAKKRGLAPEQVRDDVLLGLDYLRSAGVPVPQQSRDRDAMVRALGAR